MGLLAQAWKIGWGATKGSFKAARSGVLGRTAIGGTVGAGIGYFGNDNENRELSLESTAKGAFLGALAGSIVPGLARRAPGMLWKNKGAIGAASWGATKMAGKAGMFAFEHPLAVGGAALGMYGAYQAANSGMDSPGLAGVSINTQVAQQTNASDLLTGGMGTFGTGTISPAREYLANSTTGLPFGLHRGRHG